MIDIEMNKEGAVLARIEHRWCRLAVSHRKCLEKSDVRGPVVRKAFSLNGGYVQNGKQNYLFIEKLN